MGVNDKTRVSYRLDRQLVMRLRRATVKNKKRWPPGPSQTQIASRGIEIVLDAMEKEHKSADA